MNKIKWISGGALGLGAVLLITVNLLSNRLLPGARLDLTQHGLYTLSQGTRNILNKLDEPVTLRLFLSQQLATRLPLIGPYATRVDEMLREYARLANGKLRLEIVDPEPFSEAEDRAVGYGLQGVPLTDGESSFYFGLVASGATDTQASIPFLATEREAFLEYDVTKLIHQVAWPKRPVIGVLDTLNLEHPQGMMAMQRGASAPVALEQMRQSFDVRPLETTLDRIPEAIDVLLLIQPIGLTDSARYAIDQFVLRGGRVLAFLDPLAEDAGGTPTAADPGLAKLLAAWGVQFDAAKVAADLQLARKVQYQHAGRAYAVDYPAWMALSQEQIDTQDPVTANLGSLNVATPGFFTAKTEAGTTFTPLVQTTANAALLDAARLGMGSDLQALLRDFHPSGERYTLAARLTGSIKTAFPDGAPKGTAAISKSPQPEPKPLPAHLAESKQPVNILLIADTDLLQDRFWVELQNLLGFKLAAPSAANGSLLVNALDNLSGDNDLISVRNRGQFSRPFSRVDALRQSAELQFRTKERELMARLEQTEQRLTDLERGKKSSQEGLILNEAQQRELDSFREEKLRIRKELREVRHQLGKDIESLETTIKVLHIGLIPLLIAIAGIWLGLRRARRRGAIAITGGTAHA